MDIKKLLSKGYFPKELPPVFYTEKFANFAHDKNLVDKSFSSRPCIHNLARPGNQRRVLGIPHPKNFYNLAKVISDNWIIIETHFSKSLQSLTIPSIDLKDIRSVQHNVDGIKLPMIKSELRSTAKYILRVDISRFFHSIYTHSIPWALHGKAFSKTSTSGGLGNDLDLLIRNSQDKQTMGIPVGPDTSYIISEIIATSIDERLQALDLKGFRYIDDFEFIFYSRSEAEQAIPKIEAILQEFELALNPDKTFIEELPTNMDKYWVSKIRNFDFKGEITTSKIFHYFELLFSLYNTNKKEPILAYGISRLSSVEIKDEKIIGDLLLQCINIEPGTLLEVLHYCDNTQLVLNDKKFKEVLFNLIGYHGAMRHGSEVSWALWACIWNDYKVPYDTAKSIMDFDDSIVALLGCHAHSKKLLDRGILDFWETLMTKDSLNNGHWLLAYEADLKKWLPSQDSSNHVNNDPFFNMLKRNKVSFYKTDVEKIITEKHVSDLYNKKTNPTNYSTSRSKDDLPF